MKYTIEIPTINSLETLTATAQLEAQKWMLDEVSAKMKETAKKGEREYNLDLSECECKLDHGTINEVQNTLREMGYMTTYYPRKEVLNVDWSPRAQSELQLLKDNKVNWRFPTRKEIAEARKRVEDILHK